MVPSLRIFGAIWWAALRIRELHLCEFDLQSSAPRLGGLLILLPTSVSCYDNLDRSTRVLH